MKYTIANYNDEPRDFPNIYLICIFSAISFKRQLALSKYNEIEIDLFSVSFPYTIITWKRNFMPTGMYLYCYAPVIQQLLKFCEISTEKFTYIVYIFIVIFWFHV